MKIKFPQLLQLQSGSHKKIEPILFEWFALVGLFVFAGWLLGIRGVWQLLLKSDPTGITMVIMLIFVIATIWCGTRSRALHVQRNMMEKAIANPNDPKSAESWAAEYWDGLRANPVDGSAPMDVLSEKTHGAHGTAWWVNGLQLKLGLLGKVIGFSMLAMQIGNMQSFDQSQAQEMLRDLTSGLGVALLTTMVGLVANILLGLQLTRLDRYADEFLAQAQSHGLWIKS